MPAANVQQPLCVKQLCVNVKCGQQTRTAHVNPLVCQSWRQMEACVQCSICLFAPMCARM